MRTQQRIAGIAITCLMLAAPALAQKRPIAHEDVWLARRLAAPVVSPDGRWAAVQVTEPAYDEREQASDLWIVPTDGSAPPRQFTAGWRDTAPACSPDGAWLAFLRATSAEGPGARSQLYVMPTDGGEPRCVTDQPLGAGAPVWSPDSRRIAYVPGFLTRAATRRAAPTPSRPGGSRPFSTGRTTSGPISTAAPTSS